RVEINPTNLSWTIFLKSGTQITGAGIDADDNTSNAYGGGSQASAIIDRNGNKVTIVHSSSGYPTDTITDDLGRKITISYHLIPQGQENADGNDQITAPSPHGTTPNDLMAWTVIWGHTSPTYNKSYRCVDGNYNQCYLTLSTTPISSNADQT